MDSITPTNKTVKSKADYMALAESALMQSEWQNDRQLFEGEQNSLKRASIYAQLAIAAPEASALDDYLSVCRERDVLRSALRAVHEYFQMDVEYIHPEGLIQMVALTADPETAE